MLRAEVIPIDHRIMNCTGILSNPATVGTSRAAVGFENADQPRIHARNMAVGLTAMLEHTAPYINLSRHTDSALAWHNR